MTSQSQVGVLENESNSVKEVILAHLSAGEVKKTEITAFSTSENGDYYRGQLLPNQWREDRWIGDRDGIELKFGDLRVINFDDTRRLPFSLLYTIKRSLLSSSCFNGLADMEEFRIDLLERSVVVPS
ncbi:hypothetical protein Aduo_002985 [Ancylostoma duodenale]